MRGIVHCLGLMLLISGGWGLFLMGAACWAELEDRYGSWSVADSLEPSLPERAILERSLAQQSVHQRIPFAIKP